MKRNLLLPIIFCLVIPQLLLSSKVDQRSYFARARDVSGVVVKSARVGIAAIAVWKGAGVTSNFLSRVVGYGFMSGATVSYLGLVSGIYFIIRYRNEAGVLVGGAMRLGKALKFKPEKTITCSPNIG